MKALHTTLVTAGLLAVLGGSALAQMGPGGMHSPDGQQTPRNEKMREQMQTNMGERHARHLAELKGKLKLDASQEAAWKNFAESMHHAGKPHAYPDRAALQKMTTPERIDQMQALHAQHDAEMKKHGEATKSLYAGLNAEQKKIFDTETGRFMDRKGHAHGMHQHRF